MKQYTRKVSKGKKLINPFRALKAIKSLDKFFFEPLNKPSQETDNC